MARPHTSWGSPLNTGNPIATETECKLHCDAWNISKSHLGSFNNIGCALYTALDKAIPDQFKPVQNIGNCGFETHTASEIVDELFHAYGCATATYISKNDKAIKTPWEHNDTIDMLFKQIEDYQIFTLCANLGCNLPYFIMFYVLNNFTNAGVSCSKILDLHQIINRLAYI